MFSDGAGGFHKSFKIAPGYTAECREKEQQYQFWPQGSQNYSRNQRDSCDSRDSGGQGLYDTEKLGSSGNSGHPMTVCPYCGHRMRKHWDNCPQCGHPLTTGQDGETDMHSSFLGCVSMIVAAVVLMLLLLY